jgi:hypothetical protein
MLFILINSLTSIIFAIFFFVGICSVFLIFSRIEIFDGECKRDTVVIQKGIKDEEDGTNSYKEENGKNNTGETIDQNKKHAAESTQCSVT